MSEPWYKVDPQNISSPALLVYPERIEKNMLLMLQMTGGPGRVRPHIKTHKTEQVVRMHLRHGIGKFKCATLAEARAAAMAGAVDVLIAFQPIGPSGRLIREMSSEFPGTRFSVIVDDASVARNLSEIFADFRHPLPVYIDVDCGMHRTGIAPDRVMEFHKFVSSLPGLRCLGLHAYDGHIHETNVEQREKLCDEAFVPVEKLMAQLPDGTALIAGGTPTFPSHARKPDRECSPGTYVFWDFGYEQKLPDLPFQVAAVLLTRVVSKPGGNLLCLDIGHKAVASENPHPRVQILELPDAKAVTHSEEHLVLETASAGQFKVGDVLHGVPRHVCPTVALYDYLLPVEQGVWTGEKWAVARGRGKDLR